MAIDSKDKLMWVKAMVRGQALPLDSSSVWYSYEEALEYTKAANTTAYPGQILSVVEGEGESMISKAYIVKNTSGDLVELGGTIPVADIDLLIGTGVI